MSLLRKSREAQPEQPGRNGSSSSPSNAVKRRQSIAARALLSAAQFAHQIHGTHATREQGEARWFGNNGTNTGKGRCRCRSDREKRDQGNRNEAAHYPLYPTRSIT